MVAMKKVIIYDVLNSLPRTSLQTLIGVEEMQTVTQMPTARLLPMIATVASDTFVVQPIYTIKLRLIIIDKNPSHYYFRLSSSSRINLASTQHVIQSPQHK